MYLCIDGLAQRLSSATALQKRAAIQTLAKCGLKDKDIASLCNANLKTVAKWKHRSFIHDAPRSGAPSTLTEQDKDSLTLLCRDHWNVSTRKLTKILGNRRSQSGNLPASRTTIRRFLRSTDWGRHAYRLQKAPLLSQKNIQDRLRFCCMVRDNGFCAGDNSAREKLDQMMFTDESVVELFPTPNRQNVRIRTSDPNMRAPIGIPKHGLKVIVAGGLSSRGLTELIIVDPGATVDGEYYRRRILPNYYRDSRRSTTGSSVTETSMFGTDGCQVFMQDGAPAHAALATMAMLHQQYPVVWGRGDWPGNSPDLNPIEHVWPAIQDSVFIDPRPRNRVELIARVKAAWSNLSHDFLRRLVYSFPSRASTCIERNGMGTGY